MEDRSYGITAGMELMGVEEENGVVGFPGVGEEEGGGAEVYGNMTGTLVVSAMGGS